MKADSSWGFPGNVTIAGVTIRDGLADGDSPFMPSIGGGVCLLGACSAGDTTFIKKNRASKSGNNVWP